MQAKPKLTVAISETNLRLDESSFLRLFISGSPKNPSAVVVET